MAQVLLLCTVHQPRGAYTEKALLEVLQEQSPDVIFLEWRSSDPKATRMRTVEGSAARQYAERTKAIIVGVDDFEPPPSFRDDTDAVFDYVENTSEDFIRLAAQREEMASQGIRAINSEPFESLLQQSERAIEFAIQESGLEEAKLRHAAWNASLRSREGAMVSKIYDFCRDRPGIRAVLLVGAAHLPGLVTCIERRISLEPAVAKWGLWNRGRRLDR